MKDQEMLALLGMSKDDIADRVVDKIVGSIMSSEWHDEDGEPCGMGESSFARKVRNEALMRIDAAVARVADERVVPMVQAMVDAHVLQRTNKWGEKKGEPVSFTEYLVERAEEWMIQKVDYNGKPSSGYGSKNDQTRVCHMIDRHLHYSIEAAMKGAVSEANKVIAKGLEETVKIKLGEITKKLRVNVQT